MKTSKYLVILISCFMLSCSEKNQAIDSEVIINEVETMFKAYINQVNTKGLKGVDYYFSKDDRFHWIEDGVMQYPNHKALVEGIEAFYPSVKSVFFNASKKDITVLESDLVSVYVEYKQDLVLTSGYNFTLDGAMTILTVKEDDGSWKFLIGHSSIKKPRG